MAALIPQKMFDEQLAAMDIENFAQALSLMHISEPTRH